MWYRSVRQPSRGSLAPAPSWLLGARSAKSPPTIAMVDTASVTEELKSALATEEGPRRWVRRLTATGGMSIALAVGILWSAKHRPPPPPRFVSAVVAVGDVIERVQATGTVQPLLQVNVGAQVNGRVTQVFVDYNSIVKKGEVLAEIDPLIYGTQVSAQEANLASQRRCSLQARAAAAGNRAQLRVGEARARANPAALRAEPRQPRRP